jgi:hypothetical protein
VPVERRSAGAELLGKTPHRETFQAVGVEKRQGSVHDGVAR